MKKARKFPLGLEGFALAILLLAFTGSVMLLVRNSSAKRRVLAARHWAEPGATHAAQAMDFQGLEADALAAEHPVQAGDAGGGLLTSELRVVAIGSAYPIPYGAEVCPFSGMPQPAMNQFDRDGDGMTDDWEIKYGLDKYDASDAAKDLDGDGFTNGEEFDSATDPSLLDSHPPYVTKLRFAGMKEVPFPLVFQGVSELPGGKRVFQINTPADGKTYFAEMGEQVEGVELKRFIPQDEGGFDRLVVMQNNIEVVLPRSEKVADPKSVGELINILDRSSEIVTMGALLSLRDGDYTVLGVYPDRVTVRCRKTGEVFEVVGFAGGERGALSEGLKE